MPNEPPKSERAPSGFELVCGVCGWRAPPWAERWAGKSNVSNTDTKMTFLVGEKVKHKSSERVLVVTFIVGDGNTPRVLQARAKTCGYQQDDVWCEWIDDSGEKQSNFFRSATLEKN